MMDAGRRYSDRIALTIGGTDVTYREVLGRAGRLAGMLTNRGAGPGTFVAAVVDRSPEAVIAMIGATLSGAAYIPLDIGAPRSRMREIMGQAEVGLLTGAAPDGLAQELGSAGVPVPVMSGPVDGEASIAPTPTDPAYVIFTSGSTGRPKGVVVPHRAVVNSTMARFRVFPSETMSYLMLAPLTFDAAVAGLYFTLAAGGRLIMPTADEARDPGLIAGLVTRHQVTHLDGVPSQYAAVLEFHPVQLQGLRCVVVAGEALAQGLVRRHAAALPDVPLFNEYGPTEGTVWSTVHRCEPDDQGPYAPIGEPVDGVEVMVLGEDRQPVPIGETGEIAIAGVQLADGYLGQPELTAARFVPHPHLPDQRIYLTGDRGRWDAHGRLVYAGRSGTMVKIRGFRVEVGEVEGWLRSEPDVVDAVVLPEEFAGTTRLVAVVVRSGPGVTNTRALPALRTRLAEHVPTYMVPSLWHEVERIPLTPNGKIDRAAAAALTGVRVPGPERARGL